MIDNNDNNDNNNNNNTSMNCIYIVTVRLEVKLI